MKQKVATAHKIMPFLWYSEQAEEAANFYVSLFPDSRIRRVITLPADSKSGPAGTVRIVEFELCGQPYTAMSAGPLDRFNHAVSFVIKCDTQAELDRYWETLLRGGSTERCGWLVDRFGVYWQVVPSMLGDWMADPDLAKSKRLGEAMLGMKKFDIAKLKAAYEGPPA